MQKNQSFITVIEDMSENGEGIGKVNGYTLFIKDTVIGDEIEGMVTKAKKQYGYGRLTRIIKPSPHRVEPVCPVAGPCGGCQLQALSYEQQLLFKEIKVRNLLERIGGFENPPVLSVLGMEHPFRYRNKAQFPVRRGKDGSIKMGFYAGRTHSVIETEDCLIGAEANKRILAIVREYMQRFSLEPYDEIKHNGLLRHVLIRVSDATDQIMVCLIICENSLPHEEWLVDKLSKLYGMTSICLNINKNKTNVILGDRVKVLWGQGFISDQIADLSFQISPLSFYQVNAAQTRVLYETALDYAHLTGNETVWDLYCGIGTISLFLARKAKRVYGVEYVKAAVEDAKKNARLNQITNADFFAGKAEDILPKMYAEQGIFADVITLDPPRKGCEEEVLRTVLQMAPKKIVYVSCDPATLARDLKILCEKDYRLEKVQPVDLFPMTTGVETVTLLTYIE